MNTLKALLDNAKASTYELLAIVLPGAILVYLTGLFVPALSLSVVAFAISSYVVGLAVQGLADALLSVTSVKRLLNTPGERSSAEAYTLALLQARGKTLLEGKDLPVDALFDIVLTHLGPQRVVYDKFIALRDMARGLTLATFGAVLLLIAHYTYEASPILDPLGLTVALLGSGLAGVAFLQRYLRFASILPQVVYGQWIARELEKRSAEDEPTAAADPITPESTAANQDPETPRISDESKYHILSSG